MAIKNKKFIKKFFKTLQYSQGQPKITKELLKLAPPDVLKLLSNTAIVTSKGNINLTPNQKRLFARKRKFFDVLANRTVPLDQKRRFLVQHGGAAFIPILLSAVLPFVGELILNAFKDK